MFLDNEFVSIDKALWKLFIHLTAYQTTTNLLSHPNENAQ